MKKVFALMTLALVGASLTFTSCNTKKDWDCKCTITASGSSTSSSITVPITNSTKSDADDVCDAAEITYSSGGATSSCTLSER